ncbi:hypothetical protein ACIBEA_42155 [Streptomyces sp. NPDC051555]|uniref:hypothetical protein n=1 Tax=Streptomyces sp. NPDC051555 TaxID=3365657 RepID=UPI0037A71C8A
MIRKRAISSCTPLLLDRLTAKGYRPGTEEETHESYFTVSVAHSWHGDEHVLVRATLASGIAVSYTPADGGPDRTNDIDPAALALLLSQGDDASVRRRLEALGLDRLTPLRTHRTTYRNPNLPAFAVSLAVVKGIGTYVEAEAVGAPDPEVALAALETSLGLAAFPLQRAPYRQFAIPSWDPRLVGYDGWHTTPTASDDTKAGAGSHHPARGRTTT